MKHLSRYLKYVWPIHRKLVKLTPRCSRCAISAIAAPLTDGVCEKCRKPEPSALEDENDLYYEVPHKGEPIAMLLSGGKDSCYVLSKMVETNHNVAFAVFIDNGFSSVQSMANCLRITKKLNVDFVLSRRWMGRFRRCIGVGVRELALGNGNAAYGIVDFTDGTMIFEAARMFANKHGIKRTVCGLSRQQLSTIAGHREPVVTDKMGTLFSPLVRWNTSDDEIKSYLHKRHGMKPSSFDSHLTNNRLIPVMCALDIKSMGYCSFEPELCLRVRTGQADLQETRNLWEFLEYATKKGWMDKRIKAAMAELELEKQK